MGERVREEASRAIRDRVHDLLAQTAVVSAFWPLHEEVDLRPLLLDLARGGGTVALPVVASAPGEPPRLEHRVMPSEAGLLVRGRFGVMEPPPSSPLVDPREVGVALVPGLAASRGGSRLGYGGGFYDAFLRASPARRVGVVFGPCLVDALPSEPHDARLDVIATEDETVRLQPEEAPARNRSEHGP